MRTTLDVADHLYAQAKQLAAERRTSLTAIVEESLRMFLAEARSAEQQVDEAFVLPKMDGGRPLKGIDLDDTSELWDR